MHRTKDRVGAYVAPNLTRAAAATMRLDPSFAPSYTGNAYAQPLYLDGMGGTDMVLAVTEANQVSAFNAANGAMIWQRTLGAPQPMPNTAENVGCGNIDPLGITGTPIIDFAKRTMYLDAMIRENNAAHHRIFALSVDDGVTRPGWPVDVGTKVSMGSLQFLSAPQNQRGALALVNGNLFVPYGGHNGDCGDYHGWVVSVSADNPSVIKGWATPALAAGIWAPGGLSSDGTSVFAATGNGFGEMTWAGGEMVGRFGPGASFSGNPVDFWVPTNWQMLDGFDYDLGGSTVLVIDVPGATPSALLAAFGKDGTVYLIDRNNMGGISAPVASLHASAISIINAPASYKTAMGTYLVFKGHGIPTCPGLDANSNLIAVRIGATNPPTLTLVWCADAGAGRGSPISTTTDGINDPIVWAIGAENDNRLWGFDGDTGAIVLGGADGPALARTSRFITPIVAKGRIFVAGNGQLYAFKTN
jgi:hypothetical protein